MIFSEVYGSYFKAVSAILARAVEGTLTERELTRTVLQNAFGESLVTIPAKLTDGSWPLLTQDFGTPLQRKPHSPLTTLEKQWLKALLLDPRIQLFCPSEEGLEDVDPLFSRDQFVYYDRYSNGDDFSDPRYIEQLEYSSKDDKFRLITGFRGKPLTINLSRMDSVRLLDPWDEIEYQRPNEREKTLVMDLYDTRNALERVMLHFTDLEKETERIDDKHYRITLNYKLGDETEILIRILSFGPVLKVTAPESMVSQIRERLDRQMAILAQE